MIRLDQYLERDDCQLATPRDLFIAIYFESNGDPCKGCAYNGLYETEPAKKGKCPAYLALNGLDTGTRAARFNERPQETVHEEAARRGLSISEVRRQRRGPCAT